MTLPMHCLHYEPVTHDQNHSVDARRPLEELLVLYALLGFVLTEAMTRLCNCGPTNDVVELLESLKML